VLVSGDRHSVVCEATDLRVPGKHNIANALAAAIVGDVFDVPVSAIGEVIREFEGVPRRLETVGEKDGVLWVNDSAATTPAATLSALAAYERPAVVILGGIAKGADFTQLGAALAERARGAVLIGRAADEIAQAIATADPRKRLPVRRAPSLEEAVRAARELAQPGDVVLLSPACAAREDFSSVKSPDMFSSADERGDRFVGLVHDVIGVKS
jgi:UDP-N-acetylmuramoylalanine--D-glutamate ligase